MADCEGAGVPGRKVVPRGEEEGGFRGVKD